MAGVKISALTTSATFSDTDVLPLVSGGVTKKVTGAVVKAAIGVPPASSVGTTQLANGSVTTPKLAAGAVDAAAIGTSAVETAKINDSAVTTVKIADDNVTSAKLSTSLRSSISRGAQTRAGSTIPTTGSVKGVVILAGGSGYNSGATVSIAAPPSGVTATATATIVGGVLTGITITEEGSGYVDQNPSVTITPVSGGSGASAVAYALVQPLLEDDSTRTRVAGYSFFAITSDDSIVVAGENYTYVNGTGPENTQANQPVNLHLTDFNGVRYKPIRLYSTSDSLFALASDGSLWSVGYNGYGQLGQGYTGNSATYSQNNTVLRKISFSGGGVVKKFACSSSNGSNEATCIALVQTSAGETLYGWGANAQGQLGNGTTTIANTPQTLSCSDGVSSVQDIVSVGRNGYITLAVLFSSGRVKAAGYNGQAQLCRGDTAAYTNFDFVNVSPGTPLSNVVEISGADGNYSSLYFRTSGGLIYSVGYNGSGVLGNGTTGNTSTYPVQVSGGAMFPTGSGRYIYSTGRYTDGFVFAFKADGSLVAWGYNGYGNLGLGDLLIRTSPTLVPGFTLSNVRKLILASEHSTLNTGFSAILKTDGTLFVAGYNGYGNLGIGTTINNTVSFTQVPFDKSIIKDIFSVGSFSSSRTYLAILSNDGSVYTTGYNIAGSGLRGYGDYYVTTHVQGRI